MRYVIGAFMLYAVGWIGGNILMTALWIGVAYGFIDLMKQGRI